jgi:hypothetical protein
VAGLSQPRDELASRAAERCGNERREIYDGQDARHHEVPAVENARV